ncbi:hypothetical protein [Gemella cuniculi]|uniref:hypothetical protein n=1 Tax=Gemella cuniculi TaxID=150240 RepID=UPI000410153B|nr:hypothetical protein [Gemella cuniculi]
MKIEDLEKEINSLIEDREKAKEEVKKELQKNQNEISNLIKERTEAERNNDFKTFNKIKTKIDEKKKEKEFIQNRLENLNQPIYNGDEYFSKIKEIENSITEEIEELYKQAKPLVDNLENILLRERRIDDKANQLVEVMKSELINNDNILNGQGTTHTIRKVLKAFQYAHDSVTAVLYRRK